MSVSTYCVSITVESPIGRLLLTSDGSALTGLYMEPSREWQSIEPRTSYATASNAAGSNAAGSNAAGSNAAGSNANYAAASDAVAWPLPAAVLQLEEYFAGVRRVFDLPLRPQGTAFQRRVWDALVEIPYGQTSSYGELARRIDNPGAARAVGLANNRNPISIVVPCHRVIGADGSLTGYGGGLERKRWLLAHESLREGLLQGLQKGLHEGVRESLHEGLHRGDVAPRSL